MSDVDVSVGGPPFWILQMLMIAERAGHALIHSEVRKTIEALDEELDKVIEDFLRAVDVEALRLVKRGGKYTLCQYRAHQYSVVLCRARASTQPAWTYQNRLSPALLLYGGHPQISTQKNRRLGGQ